MNQVGRDHALPVVDVRALETHVSSELQLS
jgi:hypothetical protein